MPTFLKLGRRGCQEWSREMTGALSGAVCFVGDRTVDGKAAGQEIRRTLEVKKATGRFYSLGQGAAQVVWGSSRLGRRIYSII